ncbi:MAG: hypothetical protein IJG63_08580, partial [Oscillospiraceae bacterium]|nr:hypothetical protein [Oscillospiraceae bacterium]
LDEITDPEDVRAAITASHCGVGLLATAHSDSPEELRRRPMYRELLDSGAFEKIVTISMRTDTRTYTVSDAGEAKCLG